MPDSSPRALVGILSWIFEGVYMPDSSPFGQGDIYAGCARAHPVGVAPEPLGKSLIHIEGYLALDWPLTIGWERSRTILFLFELWWVRASTPTVCSPKASR